MILNIKRVFLIFSTFVWNLSNSKKNSARYDHKCIHLHVKYPSFLSCFNENWIFLSDFRKKFSNIKFHENTSSGSRSGPSGRTDTQWRPHRQTNMRKLIVAFRNFANVPKNAPVVWKLNTFEAWIITYLKIYLQR